MLSLPLFFIGLFYGRTGACQDTSSRFAVVLSPALFVPVTVAAQGGLQYRLSRHWSLLGEVAVPTFYPKNTQYETIKYLRTGIEVKYYSDAHRSNKSYVSFQSNYLFRKLTDKDQNFYYTKTQTFSYQNAFINSPVLSSAVKLGIEIKAGKRTFVDGFIGAGARFIFTTYNADKVVVTSSEPHKQNLLNFDDAWQFDYTLMRLHVTAGIRFGVRL